MMSWMGEEEAMRHIAMPSDVPVKKGSQEVRPPFEFESNYFISIIIIRSESR